jgi:hypothetical protein
LMVFATLTVVGVDTSIAVIRIFNF